MSDAGMLSDRPTPWAHGGREYMVARCNFDVELAFQAAHEAWARSRLEARRNKMARTAWEADHARQQEAMDGNMFAFGGLRSRSFLVSPAGMVEYAHLLLLRGATEFGGARLPREALEKLAREGGEAWDGLVEMILRRDFPNLLAAEGQSSPPPETPAPSTEGPSSG